MPCECGENFQRVFDSTITFAVYFDAAHKIAPLLWKQQGITVCIRCGEITSRVPDAELQEIRESVA
jgi:hypothetical protein